MNWRSGAMPPVKRRRDRRAILPLLAAALALGCGLIALPRPAPAQWSCSTPPYEKPTYADWLAAHGPTDDSVVMESLVEASGYDYTVVSPDCEVSVWPNTWVDIAAGNFCGGAEKEIVLVSNEEPNFTILRGPAPFPKGTGNLFDQAQGSIHPWRGVAAGDLDNDGFDEIVAVREITAGGVADLVVGKVNPGSCNVNTVVATLNIGVPGNSNWTDVAVGNFRGLGNEIALVKNEVTYFWFVRFTPPSTLIVFQTASLGSRPEYPWKALAAGNIDATGNDELIAVRKVTDGASSTVRAYEWSPEIANFSLLATSTFGNTGNHTWIGAAAGDFGGDASEAIALVKDRHSNFVVMDYRAEADTLRVLWATDLDTQPEQTWRGLAATDWLGDDQGHDEMIAVRNPTGYHRADLLAYGAPFHRLPRDTALEGSRALVAGNELLDEGFRSPEEIMNLLTETCSNTYNVMVRSSDEYLFLVEFLEATREFCVLDQQLRVWITLVPPSGRVTCEGYPMPDPDFCSEPADSPLTPWNELDYFTAEFPCYPGVNPPCYGKADCWDYLGWASLIGRLAEQYPHLVAVGIDDFSREYKLDPAQNHPSFTGAYLAEFESRLRYDQTWLGVVPTYYYDDANGDSVGYRWPDLPLTHDSMLFYFRNDRADPEAGTCTACGFGPPDCICCIADVCGEQTIVNAPGEIADMAALLPYNRRMHVGVYFSGLTHCGLESDVTIRYSHDVLELAQADPAVTGTTVYTAYPLWTEDTSCPSPLTHKYCAVRSVYCEVAGDAEEPGAPLSSSSSRLSQNRPNPFRPFTHIRYTTTSPGRVTLRLYNAPGQLVRTLVEERQPPGEHVAVWDGMDDAGRPVAAGVYYYELSTGTERHTRKALLMR